MKKIRTICCSQVKVTQQLLVADLRRVRQPRRAETVVAATAIPQVAVEVAAVPAAAVTAAVVDQQVSPVARCDTPHQIRRRNRRRRRKATHADAAAIGTVVVATGDNTRERNDSSYACKANK